MILNLLLIQSFVKLFISIDSLVGEIGISPRLKNKRTVQAFLMILYSLKISLGISIL